MPKLFIVVILIVSAIFSVMAFRPFMSALRNIISPAKTLTPEEEKVNMSGSSMYENAEMRLSFVIPRGTFVEEKKGEALISQRADKRQQPKTASQTAILVSVTARTWPEISPVDAYVAEKEPLVRERKMSTKEHVVTAFGYFIGDVYTFTKEKETATVVYLRKGSNLYRVAISPPQLPKKGTYFYSILSGMRYMDVVVP